jgi:hypothetical protein
MEAEGCEMLSIAGAYTQPRLSLRCEGRDGENLSIHPWPLKLFTFCYRSNRGHADARVLIVQSTVDYGVYRARRSYAKNVYR